MCSEGSVWSWGQRWAAPAGLQHPRPLPSALCQAAATRVNIHPPSHTHTPHERTWRRPWRAPQPRPARGKEGRQAGRHLGRYGGPGRHLNTRAGPATQRAAAHGPREVVPRWRPLLKAHRGGARSAGAAGAARAGLHLGGGGCVGLQCSAGGERWADGWARWMGGRWADGWVRALEGRRRGCACIPVMCCPALWRRTPTQHPHSSASPRTSAVARAVACAAALACAVASPPPAGMNARMQDCLGSHTPAAAAAPLPASATSRTPCVWAAALPAPLCSRLTAHGGSGLGHRGAHGGGLLGEAASGGGGLGGAGCGWAAGWRSGGRGRQGRGDRRPEIEAAASWRERAHSPAPPPAGGHSHPTPWLIALDTAPALPCAS